MSVQFKKNGVVASGNIYESNATNLLENAYKYTRENPYIVTGTSSDIIKVTDMYTQIIPGETYYLTCQTDSEWASSHGYSESTKGKVAIWLYLLKTFNASNTGYDLPILFNTSSSTFIRKGVWKYTIPSGYNMARVRFNTYSNGTDTVTCKFWDVRLIPEKYYVPQVGDNAISLHIGDDYISAGEIYEI